MAGLNGNTSREGRETGQRVSSGIGSLTGGNAAVASLISERITWR